MFGRAELVERGVVEAGQGGPVAGGRIDEEGDGETGLVAGLEQVERAGALDGCRVDAVGAAPGVEEPAERLVRLVGGAVADEDLLAGSEEPADHG